jgi:hypothetical protein
MQLTYYLQNKVVSDDPEDCGLMRLEQYVIPGYVVLKVCQFEIENLVEPGSDN